MRLFLFFGIKICNYFRYLKEDRKKSTKMFGKVNEEDSFQLLDYPLISSSSYSSSSSSSSDHERFQPLFQVGPISTTFKRNTCSETSLVSHLQKLVQEEQNSKANEKAVGSPIANPTQNANRYKTELCRPFQENGSCKYGDKCQFAHGRQELRAVNRHPKYKTDLCRTYHSAGFCPYGPRCHFIHNLDEVKNTSSSPSKGLHHVATAPALSNASQPGMPPLPMFSSERLFLDLGLDLKTLRQHSRASESSSSSTASSTTSESDSERLPVFSTLSK